MNPFRSGTNSGSALSNNQHSVFSILDAHASRRSSVLAVITAELRLGYPEFLERVVACAHSLLAQGLVPGEVTGIAVAHEIDHLICAMTLMCLGTPQVNLAHHETDAGKKFLALKLSINQVIAPRPEAWMSKIRIYEPPHYKRRSRAVGEALLKTIPLDAVLLYRTTSGSTSVPKILGITLERLRFEATRQANNPSERRVLRTSSMEFDASRKHRICTLLAGRTCVFADQFNLECLSALCASAKVSEMHIGTYKLASLLKDASDCPKLPSFTRVLTGGSRVPGVLRKAVKKHLTDNLWVSYAMTELGMISLASPEQHEAFPEGLGFPCPGVDVAIVDSKGELVPEGEIGEARIRRAVMPHGYAGDDTPSSAFRGGWFYPRDLLSRSHDGPLVFHGRVDDVMTLNGINIFASAIEDTLESHPDVREAVAYPIKSRFHGEIPVAAVVLNESAQVREPAPLLAHCRETLGIRSPRQIFIVEKIPRNWAGKPLRRELAVS
jgi:acyl-coenzyme A synthetase/AMP-(fatty) acid ligase